MLTGPLPAAGGSCSSAPHQRCPHVDAWHHLGGQWPRCDVDRKRVTEASQGGHKVCGWQTRGKAEWSTGVGMHSPVTGASEEVWKTEEGAWAGRDKEQGLWGQPGFRQAGSEVADGRGLTLASRTDVGGSGGQDRTSLGSDDRPARPGFSGGSQTSPRPWLSIPPAVWGSMCPVSPGLQPHGPGLVCCTHCIPAPHTRARGQPLPPTAHVGP